MTSGTLTSSATITGETEIVAMGNFSEPCSVTRRRRAR
jgi:hypothetical protein